MIYLSNQSSEKAKKKILQKWEKEQTSLKTTIFPFQVGSPIKRTKIFNYNRDSICYLAVNWMLKFLHCFY